VGDVPSGARGGTGPALTVTELMAVNAELVRRVEFTDALLAAVGVGIISCDADGGTWTRNPASLAVLGLATDDLGPEQAAPLLDILTPAGEGLAPTEYPLQRALRGEAVADVELLVGPAGGPHRVIISRSDQIRAADGRVLGAVTALTDVTDERAAQRELAAARQDADRATAFFDAVLAAMPDYVFVLNLENGTLLYGSRDRPLLGVTTARLAEMGPGNAASLVHPEDRLRLRATNVAAGDLADGQVLQLRYRAQHADGSWRWMNRRVTPFRRDPAGTVVEVLGVLRDITDVVGAEDALRHAAPHDPLTGLPNRALLMDRLEASLARAAREQGQVAVLFCDLDGFKKINDSAGHAAGDAVLQECAARLTEALREHDTVARVGGDEFVIVLEPWHRLDRTAGNDPAEPRSTPDLSVVLDVAQRVQAELGRPMTHEGVTHRVAVSIGIAVGPPAEDVASASHAASALLHDADAAMYQAKAQGNNHIVVAERPPPVAGDPAAP
jgi:PAS domain S-box-containing protein